MLGKDCGGGRCIGKIGNTWFKPVSSVGFLQPFAVGRKRRMCMATTSRDAPTPVPGVADHH